MGERERELGDKGKKGRWFERKGKESWEETEENHVEEKEKEQIMKVEVKRR